MTSHTSASALRRTSLWLAVICVGAFFVADIDITTRSPELELARLAKGIITPDFFATEQLLHAILNTLAFALQGVAFGAIGGFLLLAEGRHPP